MNELDLFAAAIAIADPGERVALLERECAGHPDLKKRIDQLLEAHFKSNSLLDPIGLKQTAAMEGMGAKSAPARNAAELVGTVIAGKYKLLQQIGEGGMGTVWMADQTEPVKRRVAVKLINNDRGISKTIFSRFEAERQAIAMMDHPHIAKLLDAGTTDDGSPYFIMELVKGIPLNEYCDAHKLNIRDRLQLFTQICSAVQHAHQKGIIHRDLKPSNILVENHDDKPVPKVIDFGLAKAASGMQLSENTLFTAFGTVMGTPLYMAPEQANFNAVDIDTRADVYALGVILYELLTGTTPITRETIKKAALDEMLKLVREQDAPTPSSRLSTIDSAPSVAANRQMEPQKLSRFVRGDLDWIVMKALSKERERRYETANGFARDIEHFLDNEPVSAGPPSTGYHVRKFVQRNKGQVIAVSLVLFTLLAGMAGTTWQAIRAELARVDEAEQRKKAEAKEQEAKAAEAKAVLASERAKASEARTRTALGSADKMLEFQQEVRQHKTEPLLPAELEYLAELATQLESQAKAGRGLYEAEAFARLAAVQFRQGKLPEMEQSYESAIAILSELGLSDPENAPEYVEQLARTRGKLARKLYVADNWKKCEAIMRQADADWVRACELSPRNPDIFASRASALDELHGNVIPMNISASAPGDSARQAAAQLPFVQAAVACWEKAVELRPDDRTLRLRLLRVHGYASWSPAALRATFRAAIRFPDETIPRRFKPNRDVDYPYARDRETFDSDLCERLMSAGVDPAGGEWKSNPTWSPVEAFRRVIAEPCREVLKEFPGYKYASGIEFLLKLREGRVAESVPWTQTKPDEKPPEPTAEQWRRATECYRQAIELARKPETKLPAEFLTLTLREKNFYDENKRPLKTTPITAEEYVWLHRLGRIWGVPADVLAELQRELAARPDWRPTPMFLHRVLMATLPDEVIHNADTPKQKLIALWTQADTLFARIQADVPRDGEDYRKVADRFSGVAVNVAGRFRQWGERAHAKHALTRCIELVEEKPLRPDVDDWRYRTRCYFDRGNFHLDGGEWASALADYQSCLKFSKQEPGNYDSLPIPGMNAVAHFRSGTALLRLNLFDEAEKAFDEAIKIRSAETFQSRPLKSGKPSVPWLVPITEHDRAKEYMLVGRWEPAEKWAAMGLKTLAENEEAYPIEQVNHYRYLLHSIRATALDGLKDHATAAKAWDAARQYGTAKELREFAVLSAPAYAKMGHHEEVAKRLDDLAKSDKLSNLELYNLACGYAHCTVGIKVEPGQAAIYRELAMESLQKAVKAGWKDAAHMKQDTDLDTLRDREDFKALLAELEKPAEKE